MARSTVVKTVAGLAMVCIFATGWHQTAHTAAPTPTPVQSCASGQVNGAGHLALVSIQNNLQSISLTTPSGTPRNCLATLISTAQAQLPSWSPDGKFIAFVLAYSSNGGLSQAFSLYVVSTNGSSAPRAVSNPASGLTYSWSPDSQHLVCSLQGILMITDLNGSAAPLFSTKEAGDFSPAWSPNGLSIAYSRSDGVYVADANGTNAHNISNPGQSPNNGDLYPVWSPDSSHLAFRSARDGAGAEQVYIANANGSGLVRVSDPAMRNDLDHSITWAPGSDQLAFTSAPLQGPGSFITVVNADGTHRHRLTKNNNPETNPAWSKNGKWIAFQAKMGSAQQNVQNVFVVDVTGAAPLNLTTIPLSDASPFWQP